jgi:D-methionine transport system substrate-binding protein
MAVAIALALVLTACGDDDEAGTMRVGFFPGPYADMFRDCAQPVVEDMGWTIEITEFTNAIQPNTAVMNGDVEATIFQNIPFMEQYNDNNAGSVVRILDVPTLKSAFYSKRHESFDALADGMSISLPNDPTNLSLGLEILAEAGFLTLDPSVEAGKYTEQDVTSTSHDFDLVLIDAPQAPRSLDDVDYAFILGSWIYASGVPDDQIVLAEGELTANQWIIITTRDDRTNEDWAADLIGAYQSSEFKSCVEGDPRFAGLAKPSWW